MINILVSNDDGVNAPGIITLSRVLSEFAQVLTVAPDRNCSGASNSLTLTNPLRINNLDNGYISVAGTPTDCVHLAIRELCQTEPDIVVSGINAGANMGDDTLYSGTVAAAMEGRFLGLPAIAVSLVGKSLIHYDTAAVYTAKIVKGLLAHPIYSDQILNVNVPDLPVEQIKGIKVTRLGARHKAEGLIKTKDPAGKDIYWLGPVGREQDAGEGTDFDAVAAGYVSITPLTVDLTAYNQLDGLADWIIKNMTWVASTSASNLTKKLADAGIENSAVLDAVATIPRELFLDGALAHKAYENTALPIGQGQTISQPYIVARMTELLMQHNPQKVLEIGTGSGYQAAILASLIPELCTIERIKALQIQARQRLKRLDLHNVSFKYGDGWQGWPNRGPFDGIMVTAAAATVPQALLEQLADHGVLIIPVGEDTQQLLKITRIGQTFRSEIVEGVKFVPLINGGLA